MLLVARKSDHLKPLAFASVGPDAFADRAAARPVMFGERFVYDRAAYVFGIGVLLLKRPSAQERHANRIEVARRRDDLQHYRVLIVRTQRRIPLRFPEVTPMAAQGRIGRSTG